MTPYLDLAQKANIYCQDEGSPKEELYNVISHSIKFVVKFPERFSKSKAQMFVQMSEIFTKYT